MDKTRVLEHKTIIYTRSELPGVKEELSVAEVVSIDVETSGIQSDDAFNPWTGYLVGVGIGYKRKSDSIFYAVYLPFVVKNPDPYGGELFTGTDLTELLEVVPEDAVWLMHNAKFDLKWLERATSFYWKPETLRDPMVEMWMYRADEPQGLKDLTMKFYPERENPVKFNDLVGRGKAKKKLEEVNVNLVADYCMDDCINTMLIAKELKNLIQSETTRVWDVYRNLEMPMLRLLTNMELRGVQIDIKALTDMAERLYEKQQEIETKLQAVADINWNSNKQIIPALVAEGVVFPKVLTAKGSQKLDREILLSIEDQHEAIPLLLDSKEINKLISTYIEGFFSQMDTNGRIHADFGQTTVKTGRLSCIAEGSYVATPRNIVDYPSGIKIENISVGDYVYSFNNENIPVPKKVTEVLRQGKKKVLKLVWRASGVKSYIGELKATSDHKVRLSDGSYKRMDELQRGDILSFLHHTMDAEGYAYLYWNNGTSKEHQHLVGSGKGTIARHKNEIPWDNRIENLELMTIGEHTSYHTSRRLPRYKTCPYDKNTLSDMLHFGIAHAMKTYGHDYATYRRWADEYEISLLDGRIRRCPVTKKELETILAEKSITQACREIGTSYYKIIEWANTYDIPIDYQPRNHIVVAIIDEEEEIETYDLSIEDTPNFIVNEIGVHNCRKPNLQNIPSDSFKKKDSRLRDEYKMLRQLFIGNPLICVDLSQIEMRFAAHFSEDPALLDIYRNDLDIHQYTSDKVTRGDRTLAKNVNFGCVPMDSQALTPEGWKTYEELSVGDSVLGYNQETGNTEWTQIEKLFQYDDAPLIQMSHSYWSATSTPNHRWFGERRTHVNNVRQAVSMVRTTEELSKDCTIQLAAPLISERILDVSEKEVQLIGWLLADGHIKRATYTGARQQSNGKRVAFLASVFQKKVKQCEELEELFLSIPHKKYYHEITGIHEWRIAPAYIRDVWERAKLDELTYEQFVLQLDAGQRGAFLKAIRGAEGTKKEKRAWVITQNAGPLCEAIRMAVFLEGYSPSYSFNGEYKGNISRKIAMRKGKMTMQKVRKEQVENAAVWCMQTGLGSWVMKQGDNMMITGNSLYGQEARGLANLTGMPISDAKVFVADFKRTYHGLFLWMQRIQAMARAQGYVETILGRRRYLPNIRSEDWMLASGDARKAVNTVIQGSAADYLKIAMLEIDKRISVYGFEMVLQVHDELMFAPFRPVSSREIIQASDMIRYHMEHAITLRIPVKAEPKIVRSWADAK